jgi:magnesium chelatase family protein
MLAKVYSGAVVGLEGELIEVEVDLLPGLPAVNVVGLPDTAVTAARERVRSAVRNSGCVFPHKRITVSLAPADIRKDLQTCGGGQSGAGAAAQALQIRC